MTSGPVPLEHGAHPRRGAMPLCKSWSNVPVAPVLPNTVAPSTTASRAEGQFVTCSWTPTAGATGSVSRAS